MNRNRWAASLRWLVACGTPRNPAMHARRLMRSASIWRDRTSRCSSHWCCGKSNIVCPSHPCAHRWFDGRHNNQSWHPCSARSDGNARRQPPCATPAVENPSGHDRNARRHATCQPHGIDRMRCLIAPHEHLAHDDRQCRWSRVFG